MLKQALDTLVELAQNAAEMQITSVPGDDPRRIHAVRRDGAPITISKQPGTRQIEMATLADLVELACHPFDEAAWNDRAIFYNSHSVTLVLDRSNGWELATLNLPATEESAFFAALLKQPALKVKTLRSHRCARRDHNRCWSTKQAGIARRDVSEVVLG